jgi:hypothetical protein
MSIRLIAQELYRIQQEVDKLRKELAGDSGSNRTKLEDRLRQATAERDRIRKILEGAKEPPKTRKPK